MSTDVAREPLLAVSSVDVDIAGRRLVAGLTFGAQRGEFIAVLGENGVGKTLTLHTLAGLRPAAAGSIVVQGQDLRVWPRRALARVLGLAAPLTADLAAGEERDERRGGSDTPSTHPQRDPSAPPHGTTSITCIMPLSSCSPMWQ